MLKGKIFISFLVLYSLSVGGVETRAQATSALKDSTKRQYADSLILHHPYLLDSLTGYVLRYHYKDDIDLFKGDTDVLSAHIYSLDPEYLSEVTKLDSRDTLRGFAMREAMLGLAFGDADGCHTEYTIDSLLEFNNKFNMRCFHVFIKGSEYCIDSGPDSSRWHGYFVDVSEGAKLQLLHIPSLLDLSNDSVMNEAAKALVENIRRNK